MALGLPMLVLVPWLAPGRWQALLMAGSVVAVWVAELLNSTPQARQARWPCQRPGQRSGDAVPALLRHRVACSAVALNAVNAVNAAKAANAVPAVHAAMA